MALSDDGKTSYSFRYIIDGTSIALLCICVLDDVTIKKETFHHHVTIINFHHHRSRAMVAMLTTASDGARVIALMIRADGRPWVVTGYRRF